MPIFWREGLKRGVVVVVFADPFSANESHAVLNEVLGRPDATLPPRLLLDARYCRRPMQRLVPCIAEYFKCRAEQPLRGRVAFLMSRDAVSPSGASRELLTLQAVSAEVFSEWTAAEQWLQN